MTKINGGATLWARQTLDSDIFYNKPDKWFKIWFYLINEVNHKGNKQFARGSCFMRYEWIMNKTKATKGEVDHCIRWLKSATMIATTKAIRGFNLTVLNYNTFQSLESYKSDKKSNSNGETKAKQKRNESETKATLLNKNGKYVNNGKNGKTLSRTFEKHEVVYQLTIYLEGKIRENNKSVKERTESQLQSWCKDMNLLINKDEAKPDEVKQIIDWMVEDNFWSSNIMSAKKLREHYPRFYKKVIDRGKSLADKIKNDHRFDDIK